MSKLDKVRKRALLPMITLLLLAPLAGACAKDGAAQPVPADSGPADAATPHDARGDLNCTFEAFCRISPTPDGAMPQAICAPPDTPCCPIVKGAVGYACSPEPGGPCYLFPNLCFPQGWIGGVYLQDGGYLQDAGP